MAKVTEFQWQIPVPELLQKGAVFDRWDEVSLHSNFKKYIRGLFDCLPQNLNMLFFCLHQLFFVIQFFFRSIPDIIVAYCIYVDMKVIAMKANIRSSNINQIYGKVHT